MLVSVIIPAYNVEKYIVRCLKSVLNQTYKRLEVIVVNDGSTDRTPEVIKDLLEDNKNIKLINTENRGVSSARNTGIEIANGQYIFFLDSDDRIKQDFIQLMVEKIQKDDSDVCFGGWEVYDEQDNFSTDYTEDGFRYLDKPLTGFEACKLKVDKYLWICQGTAIYRRKLLIENNIKFSSGYAYGEDIEFINKALYNSKRVSSVKCNGFENVSRKGSALNTKFNIKFLDALYLNRNFYDYVKNKPVVSKEQIDSLLISIDNDYNNIMLNIYRRLLENTKINEANRFVKENNLYLIDLKNRFTLRTIGAKWKLKYYLFRLSFVTGAVFIKYRSFN